MSENKSLADWWEQKYGKSPNPEAAQVSAEETCCSTPEEETQPSIPVETAVEPVENATEAVDTSWESVEEASAEQSVSEENPS
jgi:hypothetical protein